MNPITTNYGLLGGTLDATKHLQAAVPRLLTQGEQQAHWLRSELLIAVALRPGRENAAAN